MRRSNKRFGVRSGIHHACIAFVALVGLCSSMLCCFGQGTTTITFDGPPAQPPGSQYGIQDYVEHGVLFIPLIDPYEPGSFLGRRGGGLEGTPENGTAYLCSHPEGVLFRFQNGSLFGLSSLDLAAYSDVAPAIVLHITGYRPNGTTVSADFGGTGIQWRQVQLGPEWASGLERVEIPGATDWSIDNMVLSVPEPACGALLISAAVLAIAFRMRSRGKRLER